MPNNRLLQGLVPDHVALLGDSVFDNGAYTEGGPDVIAQVRDLLPKGWQASLLAADGSLIGDLRAQIRRLPRDVSQLVISIGGNNVLGAMDLMAAPVTSVPQALIAVRKRVSGFEQAYRGAMEQVAASRMPAAVCTIYNGNFTEGDIGLLGLARRHLDALHVGLMPFNDVILRVAFEHHFDVIDLRLVCTDPLDYANPIEPSSQGGAKIARVIARMIGVAEMPTRVSSVFY